MLTDNTIFLRALEPVDADLMYEIENDPDAWNYGENIAPLSRSVIRDYAINYEADPFRAGQLRLIITLCEGKTPAGIIDLYEISALHRRSYLGVYIIPEFRQKGLAKRAVNLLKLYAFGHLHLHNLAAAVEETNISSKKLFLSTGFRLVATIPEWIATSKGTYHDMHIFTCNPDIHLA